MDGELRRDLKEQDAARIAARIVLVEELRGAADDRSRAVIIRRVRRALEGAVR